MTLKTEDNRVVYACGSLLLGRMHGTIAAHPISEANKSQNMDTNGDVVSTAHKAECPARRSVLTNAQLRPINFNIVNCAVVKCKSCISFYQMEIQDRFVDRFMRHSCVQNATGLNRAWSVLMSHCPTLAGIPHTN